jgi:predicted RNA-binding protein associated with RNAse of E/G family
MPCAAETRRVGLFLCSNLQVTDRLLPVGATAVVRGVFRGLPWYEQAVRILESGASSVTAARWPGAATREISFYAQSLQTGDHALRETAREALARGDWELVNSAWQWTGVVERVISGRWFSVSRMFDSGGALLCWYVNFQRPPVWRPDGWDTSDLALDLVVDPDGTRRWKDEDEYAHHLRLGLITDAEHAAVQAAREEAVALVEARGEMFAESARQHWLPDPAWATPSLAD